MSSYYIFDKESKTIEMTEDHVRFAKWFNNFDNRKVAQDYIGPYFVSTVALGLNHCWDGGKPITFETMVFKEDDSAEKICERYATYDEALEGHLEVCEEVRGWAE